MANTDYRLLQFDSYDDYLNSFIRNTDYRYLGSLAPIRSLVKLGYRSSARVYDEAEFHKIRAKLHEYMNPKVLSSVLYSNYFKGTDAALEALKCREEANLMQKLATIIFLQVRQRSGFDISGYIDFEKSLRDCYLKVPDHTNWRAVFEGRQLLRPKPNDLSYYDWHKGLIFHTDTYNFEAIADNQKLAFKHKTDHKFIGISTRPGRYGENVTRVMVPSELYGYVILYDHLVR